MAIVLSNTNGQQISWVIGALPTTRSYLTWLMLNSTPGSGNMLWGQSNSALTSADEISTVSSGSWSFFSDWTSTGQWRYGSALPVGSLIHLAVTYNAGSTANDPVMYLNGLPVSITENLTPSGSQPSGNKHLLGDISGGVAVAAAMNIYSHCIFNRILTPAEILEAYNSKLAIPYRRGLIFAPNLCQANGVSNFDGAVLGSSNVIPDLVTGNPGLPASSPVGKADNLLTFQGVH